MIRKALPLVMALLVACTGRSCGTNAGDGPHESALQTQPTLANVAPATANIPHDEVLQPLLDAQRGLAAVSRPGGTPKPVTAAELERVMNQAFDSTATADQELSRLTFDVDAVAAKVGNDPVKLFEWVRDSTFFVPYRGVLRGSSGVLMDRVGNSLDRSLLLADLLRASGLEVRLAHAHLSAAKASSILGAVRPVPAGRFTGQREPLPGNGQAAIESYATANGLDAARLHDALAGVAAAQTAVIDRFQKRVAAQVTQISGMVTSPKVATTSGPSTTELEDTRDHWWVQFKRGSDWVALDPTAAGAAVGRAIDAAGETVVAADLPAELYHEVAIRVLVERASTTGLQEEQVFEHKLRPFEVLGRRVVLTHRQLNWPGDLDLHEAQLGARLHQALLAQQEWLPVLGVGDQAISQSSFSDTGSVNATPGTKANAQGGGGFADALGGGGEEAAPPDGTLTAEWVEYTIHAPGREPQVIRRTIFDLLGDAARAKGTTEVPTIDSAAKLERAFALIGETDILLLGSQLSGDFVEHSLNQSLLRQREPMMAILHGDEQHGLERLYQHATKINSLSAPLYGLALARSAFSPVADHVYLDRPNILSLHHRVKPTESGGFVGSISIDIVANYVATLPGLDSHEARLTQGVVDTTAESLFVTGCRECGQVSNVSRIWTLSQKAGVTWFPVRSARELASKDLKLQDDVRKRIEQDLSAGYTVILPSQPVGVDSQPQLGWWRVRTQSGETLGVMASGEGQAMVEYIKSKAAVVGAVFFLGTLLDCMGSDGKAGFVKAAACLGCSWQAGYGLVSIMQRVGTVMLTNLTPAVVGKLVTVGFVCLIANLM